MTDLTSGPIARHIVSMAGFIAMGLVFQSAYFLVDLYFVSQLGKDAIAGVASSGGVFYLALAASQLIGVGSLSLVSQAVGRRDHAYAGLVFNQVLGMALIAAAATLLTGYALADAASRLLAADMPTAAFGRAYLYGFLPSLACMFPGTALGASLRATGVVRPTMLLQTASVMLNVLLAPVLIAGWGTAHPLGAIGAGLASSIAATVSTVAIALLMPRFQTILHARRTEMAPRLAVWLSLAKVGLPAAGEFLLLFLVTSVIYLSIRRYGPVAQAGYGIGARVMQAMFLPTMAISFAAAPIAGQNYGAKQRGRVLETFRTSLLMGTGVMLVLTAICQWRPELFARPFSSDPAVLAVSAVYLRTISLNFVAVGVVFACSGMFQAIGDTRPSFVSSASRLFTYVLPCFFLAQHPAAKLVDFWYLSILSAGVQAAFSLWLLQRAFRACLPAEVEKPIVLQAAT